MKILEASVIFFKWVKVGFLLITFSACTHAGWIEKGNLREACTLLDSLFTRAFLVPPYVLRGKVSFDVEQHRLRGKFELRVTKAGRNSQGGVKGKGEEAGLSSRVRGTDKAFHLVSNALLGAHREDLSIFLSRGSLRILDKEREEYYEGKEAEAVIRSNLKLHGDVTKLINIALGDWHPCEDSSIKALRTSGDGIVFAGKNELGNFRIDFSGPHGRLREIVWPLQGERGEGDYLKVSYEWSDDGESPRSMILLVTERKWRAKFVISDILRSIRWQD